MKSRSKWLMLSVGLGMLLNPLNTSMVAVAIPRLQHAFRLDFTVVSWIIFTFYIASAISNPVVGKASDLFGRKKIFVTGLVVAFAASLLAPFSPSFGWLLVFRIVQSIGTSMLITVGMAVIRIQITENQATALSVVAIFQSGAAAIGPFIGGILIHWWDWPAIFFVNIPFVTASFLLSWRMFPMDEKPASARRSLSLREWLQLIDAPGIAFFTAGLVALLVGLLSFKSSGHVSLANVMIGLIGVTLLGAFVRVELKVPSPFFPLRTLAKHPAITWVNVEFMVVNLINYAIFFGIPSYLQTVRHVSEFHTGILMLSIGLCSLVASPLAGRWVDRSGPRPALLTAAILMTLGSVWVVTWNQTSPVINVCLTLAAFGVCNGLNSVGMQAALFKSSPKEIIGVASGLLSTSRNLGATFSSLLVGIVMGGEFSFGGFRWLGMILTVVALALVYTSSWRRGSSAELEE
jgi:MFS family permease